MSDINKKFHEFALQSVLFKGRSDWYFCYLKAEKIAHVLMLLANATAADTAVSLRELSRTAAKLPESVVRFAAGEFPQGSVLADIFSLLSAVRFASVEQTISPGNTLLLIEEYERIAEKLGASGHPSPFVSSDDFSLPPLPEQKSIKSSTTGSAGFSAPALELPLKDKSKGQSQRHPESDRQERLSLILEVIRKQKNASIKDISAIVKNYSEKTIQREIMALISQGLVRREGERRWSVYTATGISH